MKYTASHVANYFLACATSEKILMTPLKLMKLSYFSYAWYLYLTNNSLFNEKIEAWKHGPVIPSLFHEFKHFGLYGDIRGTYATYIDLAKDDTPIAQIPMIEIDEIENNEDINASICGVWFYYKNKSGDDLEKTSHECGSVWEKYYKIGENIIINDSEEKLQMIKDRARIGFEKSQDLL